MLIITATLPGLPASQTPAHLKLIEDLQKLAEQSLGKHSSLLAYIEAEPAQVILVPATTATSIMIELGVVMAGDLRRYDDLTALVHTFAQGAQPLLRNYGEDLVVRATRIDRSCFAFIADPNNGISAAA